MRRFSASEYVRACVAAAAVAPAFLVRPYRSPASHRAYQTRRIRKVLARAWQTPFYRKKYSAAGVAPRDFTRLEDLGRFPTVTKEELVGAIHAGELGTANGRGIDSVSAGSSGRVITVTHDVADTHAYAAGRFRILNMTGRLMPWSRTMYVYTSEFPARSFFGLYRSCFVPTIHDLNDTIRRLRDVRPAVLCVYPSRLMEIAAVVDRQSARGLGIQLISVNSETSARAQRTALAEHFGCPVLDEYSTEELGWAAAECAFGTMHAWEDMAYLEILSPDADRAVAQGGTGEIVGTNLHNLATPFIRYRQGDSGTLRDVACPCGRTFRALEQLVGRSNDEFRFSDSDASPAYLLDSIYSLLLDDRYPIADFCLIQRERDSVTFQYSLAPSIEATSELGHRIERSLARLLPASVTVTAEHTTRMHKTVSGKRNPIVSLVGRSPEMAVEKAGA